MLVHNIISANNSGISLCVSRNKPVSIVPPTLPTINRKKLGKRVLASNSIPSLFLKIVSLTKVVLLKINKITGKVINDIGMTRPGLLIMLALPKSEDIIQEPLIPNQKTKFQNRSLDSHFCLGAGAVIKLDISAISVSNYWFKVHNIIVSMFARCCKQILTYVLWVALAYNIYAMNALASTKHEFNASELRKLIRNAEIVHNIPKGLLAAIAKVESGSKAYALNIEGMSYNASSLDEAISIINAKQDLGITNIDVGIMQLNMRWHGSEFASIEEMLQPYNNVTYAAKLLLYLKEKHGNWHEAVRYYHSATPLYHKKYSRKVVLCWLNG